MKLALAVAALLALVAANQALPTEVSAPRGLPDKIGRCGIQALQGFSKLRGLAGVFTDVKMALRDVGILVKQCRGRVDSINCSAQVIGKVWETSSEGRKADFSKVSDGVVFIGEIVQCFMKD